MWKHLAASSLLVATALGACSQDDKKAPRLPGTNADSSSATAPSTSQGGAGGQGSVGGAGGQGGSALGGAGGQGGQAQGGTGGTGGQGGGGCPPSLPVLTQLPDKLSQTGLYADIAQKTLSATVLAYEPQFKLWSDGSQKARWIYLPECSVIDTSNMDDWSLPVGTRVWKEFSVNGQRIETRFMHRIGPTPDDWIMASYAWDASETEASLSIQGAEDALGTEHDIPPQNQCFRCHGPDPAKGGFPSRTLGFSAIQLSHNLPGTNVVQLSQQGRLSTPVTSAFVVPGNPTEQAALGYLHANCGHCHNYTSDGVPFPAMDMQLKTTDTAVAMTGSYLDLVNQPVTLFQGYGCTQRLSGQDVADSCVHLRMAERGSDTVFNSKQMPPLGTDDLDNVGLQAIVDWIALLPPKN